MKICLVHEEYPEETSFGGIATYQKNLAETLVKNGHEVTVVCRGLKENSEKLINGVRVIRLFVENTESIYDNYYNYRVLVSDKLRELQKHNEIDIIEVPDWGAETVLFEKYRKVPLVVRLHTPLCIWSKSNKSTLDESIHKQMLRWEKKMIESADKVISCTDILKEKVIKELKLERKDIDVIPNIANIEDFYSKSDSKKLRSKTILYCGSIEQRKGVILFAEAIPNIIEELGNVKIVFVGKDTTRNDKEISTIDYIKSLIPSKYHRHLDFKGQLPNNELINIYNSAAIGVYPSLFDNFPYVVLESMACGLPFVGSINSGMKEMLDNDTKYLYDGETKEDLANKVISLYKNKEEREMISSLLRERIKNNYSSEVIINKFINVYKSTIKSYDSKIITAVFKSHFKEKIKELKKVEGGIANVVYTVTTEKKKYIAKIYRKEIDKNSISEFVNICKKNDIGVLNSTDGHFYNLNDMIICIYDYVEGKHLKKLNNEQVEDIVNFIKIDKNTNSKAPSLVDKVDFYYNSLREMETKKINRNLIDELLRRYMKLQNYTIFDERELIHGDLTPSNILWDEKGKFTLIDLDEVTIFTKLYDLVVFAIKFSKNGKDIDVKAAKKILKPFDDYTKIDIINIWNFYILKVLLEKIYLYEIDKIDLLDEVQKTDNWEDWYYILNSSVIEDILNK